MSVISAIRYKNKKEGKYNIKWFKTRNTSFKW